MKLTIKIKLLPGHHASEGKIISSSDLKVTYARADFN